MDNQTLFVLAAAGAVGIYLYTKKPTPPLPPNPPTPIVQYSTVTFDPNSVNLPTDWQQYSAICMKGALWDNDLGTSFCSSGTVCVQPGATDKRWYCTDAAPEGSFTIQ